MLQYLKAGTIKRIHVDRRVLAQNRVNTHQQPAITVQTSKGPLKAKRAMVLGVGEMIQAGGAIKALSCGARVWYETKAAVEVIT